MLRELIDVAVLEDFVSGLSRASGFRVCVYDSHGGLIVASPARIAFTQRTGWVPGTIPAGLKLVPVPAHDPPGVVTFFSDRGIWYVVAPIYVEDDQLAGWVAVGEFREESLSGDAWKSAAQLSSLDLNETIALWEGLPALDRRGTAQPIITARWGARLLANWSRRETRLLDAVQESALVGDIAELLTGQEELPAILQRIVDETARVMRCPFCSLRLYDERTDELSIAAGHHLSERYLSKGRVIRSENPIDDDALNGNLVFVEDIATDPRVRYPQEMQAEGIVSLLTAGMIYRGRPVGVIRLYTRRLQRFRKAQRNLLRAVAHQAAIAIAHARMIAERLRATETERQLALASDLQARMMRIPAPRNEHLVTARVYQPTSHLGGDFCDIFALADGRLAATVADVVGKGIPAALLSASIRGALVAASECAPNLGALLTRVNHQVCVETMPSEFVTLLVVAFDVRRKRLGFCNAGHEPLLLWRRGEVRELTDGGIVLGLFPDEAYEEHYAALEPGDLLLLYTDGVVEAMSFDGELFGRDRLHAALKQYGELGVEQVLSNIVWDVRRFIGLAEQSDDLTMIGVRFTG